MDEKPKINLGSFFVILFGSIRIIMTRLSPRRCPALPLLLLTLLPAGADAASKKKILVIGMDGIRGPAVTPANMPNLEAFMVSPTTQNVQTNSYYSFAAQTQVPTVSGPGWSSLLTGVRVEKHGVTDNSFGGSNYDQYPSFFARLPPNLYAASVVHWGPINDKIIGNADADYEVTLGTDAAVTAKVVDLLSGGGSTLR